MVKIKKNSIVVHKGDLTGERLRVVEVGTRTTVIHLNSLYKSRFALDDLVFVYQTELFEPGDTVRVREEYADRYSESEGGNDLTVVVQYENNHLATRVEDNCGEQFTILNERLYLVKPAKGFKAGDKVVLDHDRVKKFDAGDVANNYWKNAGVMTLTEDSGSRKYKTTSNVTYGGGHTNNIPTRWLKLYEEPAKRVVGQEIKAEDIKVGDKVKATDTVYGLTREFTGTVAEIVVRYGLLEFRTRDKGLFPIQGVVFTLLEEAPEPVDENLQRLLDAEIGDIAHGTYAAEYWEQVGEGEWKLVGEPDRPRVTANTGGVFNALFRLKFGELHIYRKVEDAD